MCGLVAFFNHGDKELLDKSTELLSHRGPDNHSIYWNITKRSGLGHRRLSIIDLSDQANQPFWSEDKKLVIVYNGEIFNYLDLKKELFSLGVTFKTKSDTEVLIKGYQVYGSKILEKLNGMFSFVIYNIEKNEVFAARDHLGIKPFYYYYQYGSLVIASEIKAIINSLESLEPHISALATPMHFQTAPNTGFKDIKKIHPGHYLLFKSGQLTFKKYWSIENLEFKKLSYEESFTKLDFLLNDSIKNQTQSDVPIGVMLSGGIDSSLVAALMSKNTSTNITSFNIKIDKTDLKKQGIVDDSIYAKFIAKRFGFNHNEIRIKPDIIKLLPKLVYHLEEITVDPASINTYLISKAAKKSGIDVLLSGIGADEIFAGYRIHKALSMIDKSFFFADSKISKLFFNNLSLIPNSIPLPTYKYTRWIKKIFFLLSLDRDMRHILGKDAALTSEIHSKIFRNNFSYHELNHLKHEKYLFNFKEMNYLDKLCLSDSKIYLPDHNLQYLDKSTMAAGIEARPPLIDKRIVELSFRCKPQYKIKGNIQKYLLKDVSKKYLPDKIINRPKAPFAAPLRSWIKEDLKDMVYDLLSSSKLNHLGLFNYVSVNKILKKHYSGIEDNSQLIFRLLMTEIWYRTFFVERVR